MEEYIESLKRLLSHKKIDMCVIIRLFEDKKISEKERDYIID